MVCNWYSRAWPASARPLTNCSNVVFLATLQTLGSK
jgi:hypothetical protein